MARKQREHPGVFVDQSVRGGSFTIRWFDPRKLVPDQKTGKQKPKEVRKSAETRDFDTADTIAEQLYSLIHHPEQWDPPPEGYLGRTYEIWGVKPLSQRAGNAKDYIDGTCLQQILAGGWSTQTHHRSPAECSLSNDHRHGSRELSGTKQESR